MYKDTNVVMLSTEKASRLYIHNTLGLRINPTNDSWLRKDEQGYNLYITSDEEIKEGDWCYNFVASYVVQIVKLPSILTEECSKIIATTDESLGSVSYDGMDKRMIPIHTPRFVPQIPQSFLPIYVKAYNEGNVIGTVELEYEYKLKLESLSKMQDMLDILDTSAALVIIVNDAIKEGYDGIELPNGNAYVLKNKHLYALSNASKTKLKLTDNNEVIIKVEEESQAELTTGKRKGFKPKMYSREEVEILCRSAFLRKDVNKGLPFDYTDDSVEDWIKENLK